SAVLVEPFAIDEAGTGLDRGAAFRQGANASSGSGPVELLEGEEDDRRIALFEFPSHGRYARLLELPGVRPCERASAGRSDFGDFGSAVGRLMVGRDGCQALTGGFRAQRQKAPDDTGAFEFAGEEIES